MWHAEGASMLDITLHDTLWRHEADMHAATRSLTGAQHTWCEDVPNQSAVDY
jgi:hypothetical protein